MSEIPEELKLLEYWKKTLRLEDWQIILVYPCKYEDMAVEDAEGCIDYIETIKAAKIQIVDPELCKDSLRKFDFEEILVHELLHAKFSLLANDGDWDTDLQLRVLHQHVDEMSRILVELKRSGNGASN